MKLFRILCCIGITIVCVIPVQVCSQEGVSGEDELSLETPQQLVSANPASSIHHYQLAQRYLENGNVQHAFLEILESLKHIVKTDDVIQKTADFSADDKERYTHCLHLMDIKMEDEAFDQFSRLRDTYPHCPEILYNMTLIKANEGNYHSFLKMLYETAQYDFDCKEYDRLLGAIHVLLGNKTQAEEYFARILEADKNYSSAYVWLGKLRLMEKKFDEGLYILRKAIEINPNDYIAKVTLGRMYMELGRFDEAVILIKDAIELNKSYWEGHQALAFIYFNMDKMEESISLFKEVIVLRPNEVEPLVNLANAYQIQGMFDEAIGVYKSIIKLEPNAFQPYNTIADLYAATSNFKMAAENMRKALSLKPDSPMLNYKLGMVYKKLLMFDLTERQLKRTINIDPTFEDAYKALYFLYKDDLNNKKEAQYYYNMIQLISR